MGSWKFSHFHMLLILQKTFLVLVCIRMLYINFENSETYVSLWHRKFGLFEGRGSQNDSIRCGQLLSLFYASCFAETACDQGRLHAPRAGGQGFH